MFIRILECDRCHRRSKEEAESNLWVRVQWGTNNEYQKDMHFCPECSKLIAELILKPKYNKMYNDIQSPLFSGDVEAARESIYQCYKYDLESFTTIAA